MGISNYPNGFANGVSIKNVPLEVRSSGLANVFWVDSVHGSNGNKGTSARPFATLDYAVGRCTAGQGDVIYLAPGHVETVIEATGLALDVAGVTVIFLGQGSNKAYITFTTAVGADMDVDAADITLVNPKFVSGIDALTGPIDVNAANFTIINGEYHDAAAIAATDCVVATAGATGLVIDGWKFFVSTTGTQKESNIQLNGVDNAVLKNIDIIGDFGVSCIENVTDEVLNIRLENVLCSNVNAGPLPALTLDANATGMAKNVDLIIASGATFTSSLAKLNWDGRTLGYKATGETGAALAAVA